MQGGVGGEKCQELSVIKKRVAVKVKGKVYKRVVRSAMFGSETVAQTKRQEAELEVTELRDSLGE